MKLLLTSLLLVLMAGCAAVPRKTTLVNVQTGEVLKGGFNMITRDGWVEMPDGTRLTGKIVGVTDGASTSHRFSGNVYNSNIGNSSFSGTGNSYRAPTRGEGYCLLRSPDGKLLMEITVVSNGAVTAGYGDAVMNDGRRYKVTW